jgi:coenzyme F420 hydrogenase subunit beta
LTKTTKETKKGFKNLLKDVVNRGLCTSCGTCKGICPRGVIELAGDEWEPELIGKCNSCGLCSLICPGKFIPLPEMEKMLFGRQRDESKKYEYWLGIYKSSFAGYAVNESWRQSGASGGLATALAICALQEKKVDAVLVAGMSKEQPWRTASYLATTVEEILAAQQSKYASVPLNAALQELYHRPEIKSIAVTGLPCNVHALRKMELTQQPKKILEKIKYVIGLLCAAQLYFKGTEHLIKEWCGIENLEDITRLQYRGGDWPGYFIVNTKDGREFKFPQHDYKYHHLIPFYQRDRCMMCLDYAADVADISLGDIWKLCKPGERGWSAGLIRTDRGQELMDLAIQKEYIHIQPLDEEMILTGTIGLEEKRHGSSVRFAGRIKHGWPVPEFGYEPTGHLYPFVGGKSTCSS